MKFKAAIFDMDGTLVDSLGCWDLLWKDMGIKFLDNENFKPEHEDDKKVRTLTLKDAMYLIHKKYKHSLSTPSRAAVRYLYRRSWL